MQVVTFRNFKTVSIFLFKGLTARNQAHIMNSIDINKLSFGSDDAKYDEKCRFLL
jgi:hypothetical protein